MLAELVPSLARRAPLLLAFFLVACPPAEEPAFTIVLEDLPGGLLSVHGTSATDVWVAGGAGDGGSGAPTVLHYDGTGWTLLDVSASGILDGTDLWWVHAFDDGTVMIGGEAGTILRRTAGAADFERMTTPTTGTVFGIWGSSPTDVWAVGGTSGFAGFVWHLVDGVWTDVPLPTEHPGAAVFKVWGTGPTAVWFCGLEGTLMTLDGANLSMLTSGTSSPLFTIHAAGDDVVAIGGASNASVLERQPGGRFMEVTPDLAPRMNGVWLTGDGRGWGVGGNGEMLRRTAANEWEIFDPGLFVGHDLHAVWVDPSGGVWMVGGDILVEPLVDGVLVHRGAAVSSTITME